MAPIGSNPYYHNICGLFRGSQQNFTIRNTLKSKSDRFLSRESDEQKETTVKMRIHVKTGQFMYAEFEAIDSWVLLKTIWWNYNYLLCSCLFGKLQSNKQSGNFPKFPSTKLVNLSSQHFNIVTCSGESVSARILDLFVNVEILTGRASFVILVSQDLSLVT